MVEVCPNCGRQITEGMKFCSECGANLTQVLQPAPSPQPPLEPVEKGTEIKQEPIPSPYQAPLPKVYPQYPPQPPTQPPVSQTDYTSLKPSRPKWIVPAVIGVIVVVIIAVIAVLLLSPTTSPFPGIKDSDGDGYNDNVDAFINDKNEWKDTDGDGVGDNGDAFPNDPGETTDSDNDGVGDNSDAFPNDSTQWADRDGDGYGDNPNGINPDTFPDDPTEWKDTDSDGIGDNADIYDNGNGGIYFKVLYYNGDSNPDEGGSSDELDPYFTIWIDLDDDNVIDDNEKSVSQLYDNYDELYNPHSWAVDVPDDIEHVRVGVYVYDNDIWTADDIIDTHPHQDYTWMIKSYYPATESSSIEYNCDGSDDKVDDEADAYIECEYGTQKMT